MLSMKIAPAATGTRVIAIETTATAEETVLKARLRSQPSHPRALQWLIESLALWQGEPVRAALCAPDRSDICGTYLYPEWFADFGGPLYSLEVVDATVRARRVRRDAVGGLGDFRDLKQLRLWESR
jgi:hypothetical protein